MKHSVKEGISKGNFKYEFNNHPAFNAVAITPL